MISFTNFHQQCNSNILITFYALIHCDCIQYDPDFDRSHTQRRFKSYGGRRAIGVILSTFCLNSFNLLTKVPLSICRLYMWEHK